MVDKERPQWLSINSDTVKLADGIPDESLQLFNFFQQAKVLFDDQGGRAYSYSLKKIFQQKTKADPYDIFCAIKEKYQNYQREKLSNQQKKNVSQLLAFMVVHYFNKKTKLAMMSFRDAASKKKKIALIIDKDHPPEGIMVFDNINKEDMGRQKLYGSSIPSEQSENSSNQQQQFQLQSQNTFRSHLLQNTAYQNFQNVPFQQQQQQQFQYPLYWQDPMMMSLYNQQNLLSQPNLQYLQNQNPMINKFQNRSLALQAQSQNFGMLQLQNPGSFNQNQMDNQEQILQDDENDFNQEMQKSFALSLATRDQELLGKHGEDLQQNFQNLLKLLEPKDDYLKRGAVYNTTHLILKQAEAQAEVEQTTMLPQLGSDFKKRDSYLEAQLMACCNAIMNFKVYNSINIFEIIMAIEKGEDQTQIRKQLCRQQFDIDGCSMVYDKNYNWCTFLKVYDSRDSQESIAGLPLFKNMTLQENYKGSTFGCDPYLIIIEMKEGDEDVQSEVILCRTINRSLQFSHCIKKKQGNSKLDNPKNLLEEIYSQKFDDKKIKEFESLKIYRLVNSDKIDYGGNEFNRYVKNCLKTKILIDIKGKSFSQLSTVIGTIFLYSLNDIIATCNISLWLEKYKEHETKQYFQLDKRKKVDKVKDNALVINQDKNILQGSDKAIQEQENQVDQNEQQSQLQQNQNQQKKQQKQLQNLQEEEKKQGQQESQIQKVKQRDPAQITKAQNFIPIKVEEFEDMYLQQIEKVYLKQFQMNQVFKNPYITQTPMMFGQQIPTGQEIQAPIVENQQVPMQNDQEFDMVDLGDIYSGKLPQYLDPTDSLLQSSEDEAMAQLESDSNLMQQLQRQSNPDVDRNLEQEKQGNIIDDKNLQPDKEANYSLDVHQLGLESLAESQLNQQDDYPPQFLLQVEQFMNSKKYDFKSIEQINQFISLKAQSAKVVLQNQNVSTDNSHLSDNEAKDDARINKEEEEEKKKIEEEQRRQIDNDKTMTDRSSLDTALQANKDQMKVNEIGDGQNELDSMFK